MAPKTLPTLPPLESVAAEEERLFQLALRYYGEGNYVRARSLLRSVIKKQGKFAEEARGLLRLIGERADELPFAAGVYLFGRGHYAAALDRFRQAAMFRGRRKAEALAYAGQAASHLAERMREGASAANLQLLSVPDSWGRNLIWPDGSAAPAARVEMREVVFDKTKFPFFSSPFEAVQRELPTPAVEMPAPRDAVVRRTPHLHLGLVDLKGAGVVQPGEHFSVFIYTDDAPQRPGEEVTAVEFEAPRELSAFNLLVRLLVTEHFVIEDDPAKTLVIKRDEVKSDWLEFKVRARTEEELAESQLAAAPAAITAAFSYNNRPSGKVSRVVRIARPSADAPAPMAEAERVGQPEPEAESAILECDPQAVPADLIVRILEGPERNGRSFQCGVQTALLPEFAVEQWGPWSLPQTAPDLMQTYFEAFTSPEASNDYRLAALQGAGEALFEAAPEIFKKAFRMLIDAQKPLRTISILSEEPYIPWELMIPTLEYLDGGARYHEPLKPLGVAYILARWTAKGPRSARQKIPMSDCYVIAPKYTDKRELAHAQEEAVLVLKKVHGTLIDPASFTNIRQAFGAGGKSVIHFACHGENPKGGEQLIHLTSKPPLKPFVLSGEQMIKRGVAAREPFVFINACEVGRPAPALAGVGGFAETFIRMGARAVLAPLWSVRDDIAFAVAQEFYERAMREPELSLAEIVRQIRARAYDAAAGEDSYAAYCFYGDPLGTRAS